MPIFETPEPIAVTVTVPCGHVTVITSERADTVVEVRPTDESRQEDVHAAQQTEVDFVAPNLTVKAPKGRRTYTPLSGNPSIELTIAAPTASRLNSTIGTGRLLATGELGQCELELSAGDITVNRPRGSVTAKTAKGNIRIGEASCGVLRLETSAGELEVGIRPGAAARLEVNAQYGTIQNLMEPIDGPGESQETVQVYARNSFGNIIIRHAGA
jgi:DUF4097 and DUF4098 domain-containing protein YvlB